MKFPKLPAGARFRWQGEMYRKTGPMTASPESGGERKLIPRSAVVEPVDATAAPPVPAREDFTAAEVEAALGALMQRVRDYAETLDGPERSALEAHLDEAAWTFRAALKR
ncbi:MAG: hypothetical protein LJE69_07595 [Thiohalocapsa sp.]|jgi:hypothetical protein|uniref:hypothetical protein n=1 Tax=Thiohalocapsa sp. TaxID=2497641 RepID=UPI0025EB67A1|nr:hypothetical protein [Thiohalocapsa sp.]MCG6941098.1 hypothetical protein [Thiohalocapsa sp.]